MAKATPLTAIASNIPVYHLGRFNHLGHLFVAALDENDKPMMWNTKTVNVLRWMQDEREHGKCLIKVG